MSIRVIIIEDHRPTRDMLAALIETTPDSCLLGAYDSGVSALADIETTLPDIALVDINLRGDNGIECVRQINQLSRRTQCIMCTSLEDADTIFQALTAGAKGYLIKSAGPSKIVDAIRDAHEGGSPMSSSIARKVITYFQKTPAVNATDTLTECEREIIAHLSKGTRYKEIAAQLFISTATVRNHIHNIYEKLQVGSRTEALNKVFHS